MKTKSEQARLYGRLGSEQTLEQSHAANALTEKLIASGKDDFDLSISQCIHSLVIQVRQHRNINMKAAKKIVADFIEEKL